MGGGDYYCVHCENRIYSKRDRAPISEAFIDEHFSGFKFQHEADYKRKSLHKSCRTALHKPKPNYIRKPRPSNSFPSSPRPIRLRKPML